MSIAVLTPPTLLPRFLLPAVSRTCRIASFPAAGCHPASNDQTKQRCLIERPVNLRRSHHVCQIPRGTARLAPKHSNSLERSPLHRYVRATSSARYGLRSFSSTTQRARDHHFDTLKFVQRFRDEGFNEQQAVAMMNVLSNVVEERLDYSGPRAVSQ